MRGRDTVLRADKSDRAETFAFRVSFDRMERGAGTVLRADRPDRSDRDAKDASDAAVARECAAKHLDPGGTVKKALMEGGIDGLKDAKGGPWAAAASAVFSVAKTLTIETIDQIEKTETCIKEASETDRVHLRDSKFF